MSHADPADAVTGPSPPAELIRHKRDGGILSASEIATLVDGDLEAGPHVVSWDGRDEAGQPVASGVYFYRLASAGVDARRRALLVR